MGQVQAFADQLDELASNVSSRAVPSILADELALTLAVLPDWVINSSSYFETKNQVV